MNRISTLLLSVLYLTFSTGLVLHNHFCNGKLAAVNLLIEKQCCADANGEKSCCRDTAFVVKVKDSYDSVTQHVERFQPQFYLIGEVLSSERLHTLYVLSDLSFVKANRRDLLCKDKPPIYLVNRVFII